MTPTGAEPAPGDGTGPADGEAAPTELEATLAVVGPDPGRVARGVADLETLAGRPLGPSRDLRLHDVYLDLPGEPLLRQGRAFRLRCGDGPPILALKGGERGGDGPGVEREERETPWGPAAEDLLRRVAGAGEGQGVDLASAVAAARDGREPRDALAAAGFDVLQDRATRRILRPVLEEDRPVGEMAVDEVRFDAAGRACVHREVEVEAAVAGPAGRRLLREAVDDLRDRFGSDLRPWDRSKLATGRALVALLEDADAPPGWLAGDGSVRAEGYDRVEALLAAHEQDR